MNNNIKGALLALASFAIFATHDVFLKYLGGTYAPFQILFFAVLFGFPLTLLLLLFDKTQANLRPRHPWWTLLRSSATVVSGICAVYAFSTLPLSQVYAILFALPLLITILSIPILGEKVRLRRTIAILVGLGGVIIVLQPSQTELTLGHAAAMIAAFGSALASIIIRKIGADERSIVLLLIPQMASFIVMAACLGFVYKPMPIEDLGAIACVSILGVCAMMLIIAAYNRADPVIVAPMQYSQIIWATGFGYFLFDESLSYSTFAGAAIIILSGLYILLRESGGASSDNQPVRNSSDVRPTFALRPRVGDFFRVRGGRG